MSQCFCLSFSFELYFGGTLTISPLLCTSHLQPRLPKGIGDCGAKNLEFIIVLSQKDRGCAGLWVSCQILPGY